ncbi:hypothetical protein BN946_scf184910.g1 [Trametes cinnabarina]|uniref:Uncharacterized protein n=1 Tax=Pycnoporus cinnabarinus TaxID=5643 RepID=A0A060SAF7_PYCCI|nr:hypothetical protein BN946_scf184910.g1 [Trametes cinnabarina]
MSESESLHNNTPLRKDIPEGRMPGTDDMRTGQAVAGAQGPQRVRTGNVQLIGGQGVPKSLMDAIQQLQAENRELRERMDEQTRTFDSKIFQLHDGFEMLMANQLTLRKDISEVYDVLGDAVNNEIPFLRRKVDELEGKLTGATRATFEDPQPSVPVKKKRDTHLEAVVHSVMQHLMGITHADTPPENELPLGVFWTREPRQLRPRWEGWVENLRGWVPEILEKIRMHGSKYSKQKNAEQLLEIPLDELQHYVFVYWESLKAKVKDSAKGESEQEKKRQKRRRAARKRNKCAERMEVRAKVPELTGQEYDWFFDDWRYHSTDESTGQGAADDAGGWNREASASVVDPASEDEMYQSTATETKAWVSRPPRYRIPEFEVDVIERIDREVYRARKNRGAKVQPASGQLGVPRKKQGGWFHRRVRGVGKDTELPMLDRGRKFDPSGAPERALTMIPRTMVDENWLQLQPRSKWQRRITAPGNTLTAGSGDGEEEDDDNNEGVDGQYQRRQYRRSDTSGNEDADEDDSYYGHRDEDGADGAMDDRHTNLRGAGLDSGASMGFDANRSDAGTMLGRDQDDEGDQYGDADITEGWLLPTRAHRTRHAASGPARRSLLAELQDDRIELPIPESHAFQRPPLGPQIGMSDRVQWFEEGE